MLEPSEIGWLAGIFDGEGSARIFRAKNPSGSYSYFPQVSPVSNTDPAIIERTIAALRAMGIDSQYHCRREDNGNVSQKGSKPHWKKCGDIRICNRAHAARFLETVIPLTTGLKREQAKTVLAFINARAVRPHTRSDREPAWQEHDKALYEGQSFRVPRENRAVN